MRFTIKTMLVAGFVTLSFLTYAQGGEMILRLACVGGQVMEQYRVKTGGFFSRQAARVK